MFQRFTSIVASVSNAISSVSDDEESDEEESEKSVNCNTPPPAPVMTGPDLSTMTADQLEFEGFEFEDLLDAARDMYVDKRYTHSFQVRGPNYLEDKKKMHPGPAICKLMLLELYEVESKDGDRHDHIATRGLAKKRMQEIAKLPGNPFQIIINFQIPGDPPVSIVTYFAVPPSMKETFQEADSAALKSLFDQFINMPTTEEERMAEWETPPVVKTPVDDSIDQDSAAEPEIPIDVPEVKTASSWYSRMPQDITWPTAADPGALPPTDFRNMRFKLVPSVTEGPWVVKAAVRPVPALLGRKVVQRYFRGENYMEIDIHVGSSVIASQVVGVCRGYGKHFAADVGIVIQGEDPSELPEKMLGCVCFHKIDMEMRQILD